MRAVSLWGTHLNLPRVRFKRCGGSKQTVLREKLAHRGEDNIRLSQTTQSIVEVTQNYTKKPEMPPVTFVVSLCKIHALLFSKIADVHDVRT